MGYVGCGFMAQKVHLPNLLSIPECELVALAEVRRELGRKVARRLNIPRLYADHRELAADPEIDAVAVSAGFSLQGDIARDLLLAGKHVFMEKPMAVSVEQAREIVDAAESAGVTLMVGYMKRYDAGNQVVKDTLDAWRASGEAGDLVYARNHGFCGDWVCGLDTPMDTTDEPMPPAPPARLPAWLPAEYVGQYLGYLQQYTHNVNLLRWLLDAGDDVRVKSVDLDDDGYTGIVILDVAGVRTVLETGRLSYHSWDEHTQIYFRDGWVRTVAPPLLLKNVPAEVEVYRGGQIQTITRPLPRDRWSWSYRREVEAFVGCVLSGEPLRASGQDTLTDVRLFEEIFKGYLAQRGAL
jgi:predicted dehydrogenase